MLIAHSRAATPPCVPLSQELGASWNVEEVPEDMKDLAAEYREKLVETVVELDDDAMMAYLDVRGPGGGAGGNPPGRPRLAAGRRDGQCACDRGIVQVSWSVAATSSPSHCHPPLAGRDPGRGDHPPTDQEGHHREQGGPTDLRIRCGGRGGWWDRAGPMSLDSTLV